MNESSSLKIKLFSLPGEANSCYRGVVPWSILPYGMGVVTAALRQEGYYVEQDDLMLKSKIKKNWRINPIILTTKNYVERCLKQGILEPKLNQLAEEILMMTSYEDFNVIGFSISFYPQLLFALLLAEKIKQKTGSLIVFGGSFITLRGQELFHKYTFIDFMIVGDGEAPFLKLLDSLQDKGKYENIPGLLYRDNGIVKITPRGIYNIEDMLLPDFDGLQLDLYSSDNLRFKKGKMILPYQISRGCLHRCSFCVQRSLHEWDIKSFNKILNELKEYGKRYRSNYFLFCDWTINISYGYMDKLCELLIENKLNFNWMAWARVDNLDEKLLNKMKESGCVRLLFGIESGSDNVLQLMRKDFNVKRASETLKLAHTIGIDVFISLVVGFPYEIQEDINKTIKFLRENSKYIDSVIALNIFHLEFNSPIYNNPEEFKVKNLISEYGFGHRTYFTFDETYGLKWKQKIIQQKKAYAHILKAIYYNIFKKYPPKFRIPFLIWLFYVRNKKLFKYFKIRRAHSQLNVNKFNAGKSRL